jgi:hypothetical protein
LAGGFAFAAIYERTRYQVLRAEGQQLYFYAAVYAVALGFASRMVLWITSDVARVLPLKPVAEKWNPVSRAFGYPGGRTFIGAFVLGVCGALVLNLLTDRKKIARKVIEEHGGQLEQFLYDLCSKRGSCS